MRCNESLLKAINRFKLRRALQHVAMTLLVLVATTACDESNTIGDLEEKYPIEIESCVCRYLAFEADSYSRLPYDEMVRNCNNTIRSGHPSLPPDITSTPTENSLRCTEAVEDWREKIAEERAQQASNRRNYVELSRTNTEAANE